MVESFPIIICQLKEIEMSKEKTIGLAELIEKVKHELLSTETDAEGAVPLFSGVVWRPT